MALTMMLALVACGGGGNNAPADSGSSGSSSSSSSSSDSGSSAPSNEGGELKDTLTWAQSADVFSFDPNVGKETVAIQVTGNIYDTLFTIDVDGNILPMLATEYEQEDEVTYLTAGIEWD